jgi:hypothetical protein
MTTYIHVNKNRILSNLKHGKCEPVITIKSKGKNTYCHEVEILGPSRVIYDSGEKPILSCGARCVIATEAPWKVIK